MSIVYPTATELVEAIIKSEELQARLDAQQAELVQWHNLIAVLCRDGGDYRAEHTIEETSEYIMNRVFGLQDTVEKLTEELTETCKRVGFTRMPDRPLFGMASD